MGTPGPGFILAHKYRITGVLGKGGFGTVYRATDITLDREVALKVLHTVLAADAGFVFRFQNEAKVVAGLSHSNIVDIYELGQDDGRQFIVMELMPGGTLQDRLTANGKMSFADALPIIRQVAAGLEAAHQRGMVHRDVKPANILFAADGHAAIGDFGLVRATQYSAGSATSSTGGVGTPAYKAPELWRGTSPASPATDVYALGCVVFEMLSGRVLFSGNTPEEAITRHLIDNPDFGPNWPPAGAPAGLAQVVARAVARNPDERYPTAGEFGRALDGLMRPQTSVPGQAVANDGAQRRLEASTLKAPPRVKRERQRKLWPLLAGSGVVLLLGCCGFLLLPALFRRPAAATRVATATFAPAASSAPKAATPQITQQTTLAAAATQAVPTASSPPPAPTIAPVATSTTPSPEPTRAPVPTETSTSPGQAVGRDFEVLLPVTAGDFWMGAGPDDPHPGTDELPQHPVYLDSFWIDKTEITNAQFAAFLNAQASLPPKDWVNIGDSATQLSISSGSWRATPGFENYPIVNVYFDGAQAYCRWAKRRLPSEAEWEKAARGPDRRRYPWGNQAPASNRANFADASSGATHTTPVGQYSAGASPYGALDMAGNVWEWVADWYAKEYYATSPARNPLGPSNTGQHVLRGGSWKGGAIYLRTTARGAPVLPQDTNPDFGFRCASNDPPVVAVP